MGNEIGRRIPPNFASTRMEPALPQSSSGLRSTEVSPTKQRQQIKNEMDLLKQKVEGRTPEQAKKLRPTTGGVVSSAAQSRSASPLSQRAFEAGASPERARTKNFTAGASPQNRGVAKESPRSSLEIGKQRPPETLQFQEGVVTDSSSRRGTPALGSHRAAPPGS